MREPPINPEDLEPPAAEATALLPENAARARHASSETSPAGWTMRAGTPASGAASAASESSSASRANDETQRDRQSSRVLRSIRLREVDDDGPNPLPPAIESGAAASIRRPRALVEENLVRTAQTEANRSSQPAHQAVSPCTRNGSIRRPGASRIASRSRPLSQFPASLSRRIRRRPRPIPRTAQRPDLARASRTQDRRAARRVSADARIREPPRDDRG